MVKKFWFVWNPNGLVPRHKHDSRQDACKEAERLAACNLGQMFHVLEWRASCVSTKVQWETDTDDEILGKNSHERF